MPTDHFDELGNPIFNIKPMIFKTVVDHRLKRPMMVQTVTVGDGQSCVIKLS